MNDGLVATKFRWGKWAVGEHFGGVKRRATATHFNWELEIEPETLQNERVDREGGYHQKRLKEKHRLQQVP